VNRRAISQVGFGANDEERLSLMQQEQLGEIGEAPIHDVEAAGLGHQEIEARAKAVEQRKGPPKKGEDNILSIMTDARRRRWICTL
jgi:N12 class adenine-specific DNA methylase